MFSQVENIAKKADAAWKNRDADAMAELYAASAIVTDPLQAEPLGGVDAIRRDTAEFFRAFPDVALEQLNVFAADERTGAIEWRVRGTNTGPLVTVDGQVPATGKAVEFDSIGVWTLDDRGLISREKRFYDALGLLTQLGLAPGVNTQP
jgi:steroid delta-isomerase-like uncharacterized protein